MPTRAPARALFLVVILSTATVAQSFSLRSLLATCFKDACGISCKPRDCSFRDPRCRPAHCSNSVGGPTNQGGIKPEAPSEPQKPQTHTPQNPQAQPPQKPEPPAQACFGELPFGLENCICDGAAVGEGAGLAACGRMAQECATFVPFAGSLLEAVQQTCDTFSFDACMSAAQIVFTKFPGCAEMYKNGQDKCTGEESKKIWGATVKKACKPLCPDCPHLPEADFPGEKPEPKQPKQIVPPKGTFPKEIPPEKLSPGCFDELPFGLENCICEGDKTGKDVGKSACQKVLEKCSVAIAFSLEDLDTVEEVQQVCDKYETEACTRSAFDWARDEPACLAILEDGDAQCTKDDAMDIFEDAVNWGCSPKCTDCERYKNPGDESFPF